RARYLHLRLLPHRLYHRRWRVTKLRSAGSILNEISRCIRLLKTKNIPFVALRFLALALELEESEASSLSIFICMSIFATNNKQHQVSYPISPRGLGCS